MLAVAFEEHTAASALVTQQLDHDRHVIDLVWPDGLPRLCDVGSTGAENRQRDGHRTLHGT